VRFDLLRERTRSLRVDIRAVLYRSTREIRMTRGTRTATRNARVEECRLGPQTSVATRFSVCASSLISAVSERAISPCDVKIAAVECPDRCTTDVRSSCYSDNEYHGRSDWLFRRYRWSRIVHERKSCLEARGNAHSSDSSSIRETFERIYVCDPACRRRNGMF